MSTIMTLIRSQADRIPTFPAIFASGRAPLSYQELRGALERSAAALNAMGIGRGSRVALILPPGPEATLAFVAVASIAIVAPLSPLYRERELAHAFKSLRVDAAIVPAGEDRTAHRVALELSLPLIELEPCLDEPAGVFRLTAGTTATRASDDVVQPSDDALLLQTSGTTSTVKTVALTHANICAAVTSTARALEIGPDDRCLNLLPLFHLSGTVFGTLTSLAAGGGIVSLSSPFDARSFYGLLEEFEPTWISATPTVLQAILARAPLEASRLTRTSLRFIRSSAAALSPQLLEAVESTFHVPVVEAYSLTEAPGVTSNVPRTRKAGSVGTSLGPEIAVVDDSGASVPAGTAGNINVRGPNVMRGYDGESAEARAVSAEGWFCTGDLGYLDAEGFLYLTGRTKEIIKRGGEIIAPREIEEALLDNSAVREAAVFAIADSRLGEDIAAAIVRCDGSAFEEADVRDFVAARLSASKVPRYVVFVEELPRSRTGKVLRRELALAVAATTPDTAKTESGPPRTPVETFVAELWEDFFGISGVQRDANFFDFGGDSLLAARFVSRLRATLDISLALHRFFENPTVFGVAVAVEALLAQEESPEHTIA